MAKTSPLIGGPLYFLMWKKTPFELIRHGVVKRCLQGLSRVFRRSAAACLHEDPDERNPAEIMAAISGQVRELLPTNSRHHVIHLLV